jgi:hypothetical protein
MREGWSRIEAEAKGAFVGKGKLPLPAYSEFMPPPYVGIKPYDPTRAGQSATFGASDETSLDVSEYEMAHEIRPGLASVAEHIAFELAKLQRGEAHALSRTLLEDNPAWPAQLADAAAAGKLAAQPLLLAMPLALSRTQDDKGNDRWTLFGASHDGPSAAFWRSFEGEGGAERFAQLVGWATGEHALDRVRIVAEAHEVPPALRSLVGDHHGARVLVTFRPFASLSNESQQAYLGGRLTLFPSPASLVFFEHPKYKKLAKELPHATQISLLHLFPRCEAAYTLRIPQSGWLDEHDPSQDDGTSATRRGQHQEREHGHRVVSHVVRTHRWQRVHRDDAPLEGDGAFTDEVTVALFSSDPDDLGLYGKPMARNAQIWTKDYELLLDGPRADKKALEHAARVTDAGGRFGYRFLFPAMRAGVRELFWHLPLVAKCGAVEHAPGGRTDANGARTEVWGGRAPLGYVSADAVGASAPRIVLAPRVLARDGHVEAATLFPHDPGRRRLTTCHNARKVLEMRELLGAPLAPSYARALLRVAKDATWGGWLDELPTHATDRAGGERLSDALRACVGAPGDLGTARTFERTATRAFEEEVWSSIASLAEGEFRQKENADAITVNDGKHGGPAAKAAHLHVAKRRDLESLGDHLHARYRALAKKHGMEGRAEAVDHVFKWDTDFEYAWMQGWAKNQTGEALERNVVFVIPGENRHEAVIMGDHYDTAYMEDVYEAEQGGDGLRAPACGADDNHSATTALLLAADVLLPLAKAGKLERDVWLVHLTGEEFPGDSLGARALAQEIVEERLVFTAEDGKKRDTSRVRIAGAYVLDMIGHNTEKDRDVFQIAPGEGAASARLARIAHVANERWNRSVEAWNRAPDREGRERARRMPDGSRPPPPFAHLPLDGEVRVEWEPRSALYNTDGQCFSDVGIPVVLFMENYDISRKGYHDTHDTMANIDLDYCAALTAIAIETVAEAACAPKLVS